MTHTPDKILPANTQIGVYEIKDAAKIGPFDITYRAWNHHLKESVKIQEYFPQDFAARTSDGLGVGPKSVNDKENFDYGLKAFLDQAEILTQIEHPNIVVAENVLQLNGTAYLIMDMPQGVSLSRLIQPATKFAEEELRFILVSVLTALQKIHEHKIVHGGIQPSAILMGKDGEPLLSDFAAARLAIAARTAQLADGLAAGYAAAEQYEPAKESGPATDFYALGATMYYCMTHRQPVVAQSRIAVLGQGEADPMALPSDATDVTYSTELLQAVSWMLQPEYSQRPQSASEILTLLKSTQGKDQQGALSGKQTTTDTPGRNKNSLLIGAIAGIVALVIAGVWFEQKPVDTNDKPGTATTQALLQHPSEKTTPSTEPGTKTEEDQLAASTVTEPSEASGSDKELGIAQETMKETEPAESPAEDNMIIEVESDKIQQLVVIDQSLPQSAQPNSPEKSIDDESIRKYLIAAEKGMKAERLTTPLKNNANKYYQKVLAIDPDNAEARAGLQKIVDRYIQFISKARAESRLNDANLYLQRAESVLPNDSKLKNIRAELAAK